MMKLIIDVKEEFTKDFERDNFGDFFQRVLADIDNHGMCGNYEKETAKELLRAFQNATVADGSLADTAEGMVSSDYKERFKAEYQQLVTRYNGLSKMLEKWDNGTLNFTPTCPRGIYNFQIRSMKDYIDVLETRAAIENIEL